MEKKFYVTPKMEEMGIKIETVLFEASMGGSDPGINTDEPEPGTIILDD